MILLKLTWKPFLVENIYVCLYVYLFVYRIRLPEDRDPRQGRSPLFGVLVALEGSAVGRVVQLGESVAICS